jgi:hypothetical protein
MITPQQPPSDDPSIVELVNELNRQLFVSPPTHRSVMNLSLPAKVFNPSDVEVEHLHTFMLNQADQLAEAGRTIEQLNDQITQANNRLHWYQLDVEHISDALIEEANDRDWCSIYDEFVRKLNASLTIARLVDRIQTFSVEHTYAVTITSSCEAHSADEAEQMARHEYNNFNEREMFLLPPMDSAGADLNYSYGGADVRQS